MKVRLFFRLLSHDITEGIIHNRKFFIFAALLFIFIDFVYWHNISLYFSDYNSVVDCGVLDFFMNVFAGCDPFDPEANKGVDIPITSLYNNNFLICLWDYTLQTICRQVPIPLFCG